MTKSEAIKVTKAHGYTAAAGVAAAASMALAQGTANAQECNVQGGLDAGVACAQPEGRAGEATLFESGGIFNVIVNTLLFIVGAISVIMLIIGGIRYVVSGGDSNAVSGAKNTILYAIVGLIVSFLAFAAVNFVLDRLGT